MATSLTVRALLPAGVVALALAGASEAHAALGFQPDVAGPAAIATPGGGLEVFVRGQNDELVQRTWNGAAWSGSVPSSRRTGS